MQIVYASRARGDTTDRVVSPQRLVHYRDNWYLDAYCHLRERLSTFSIDAMVRVQALKESAIEISGQEISFPYSDTRELMMDKHLATRIRLERQDTQVGALFALASLALLVLAAGLSLAWFRGGPQRGRRAG